MDKKRERGKKEGQESNRINVVIVIFSGAARVPVREQEAPISDIILDRESSFIYASGPYTYNRINREGEEASVMCIATHESSSIDVGIVLR